MPLPVQTVLPRWRGFNLTEMTAAAGGESFVETDFDWIAEWGFDFVRLPLAYPRWIRGADVYAVDEAGLREVDRGVALGRARGLHVCLAFHRAPGYCVNDERAEPFDLWKDAAALDAFCFHWRLLAERYRGIPARELSFNLVNEPPHPSWTFTRRAHRRVIAAGLEAIHAIDPQRLVIADGVAHGAAPCPELADLPPPPFPPLAQSCRAYAPFGISHYRAPWVDHVVGGPENWPLPRWPGGWHFGMEWGRDELEEFYRPWAELAAGGIGIHCGEAGVYNQTPHAIALAWLREVLEVLTGLNIGYALWNFRGAFGPLDSGRRDVAYETFHGHPLDRPLLELLREF